jgi:hypothetical protein
MIVSLIADIVIWQLGYTYTNRLMKGDLKHSDLVVQILQACNFIANTTFYLAHWLFAFSYLVLSYRMELNAKKLPLDTQSCRLNTLKILFCLFNMILEAIYWIYAAKEEYKAIVIANDIE